MTEDHTTPHVADEHTENTGHGDGTRTEEFTVSANKLLGKVKEIIKEGNVRRIILRSESGQTLLEIPLNAGVAGVAALALFAPALVAVGALAALVTSVSITVVRERKVVEVVEETFDA